MPGLRDQSCLSGNSVCCGGRMRRNRKRGKRVAFKLALKGLQAVRSRARACSVDFGPKLLTVNGLVASH